MGDYGPDWVTMCVCVGVIYTLFSNSLSSSVAIIAGAVGQQKLVSQIGTLLLTAASPACTAPGGSDCGDSQPAGRD